MAKPRRWFEMNEKVAAKKVAKSLDEVVIEYRRTTRTGVVKQLYVGTEIPKAFAKGDYDTKVVFTPGKK